MDELEVGIKSGRYFSGILRCRKDSRDQAYVSHQLGKDILIVGNDCRNRAGEVPWNSLLFVYQLNCLWLLVHGDVVVVDLLSENHWTTPSSEIAFNSSNAEDGKIKIKITILYSVSYSFLHYNQSMKRIDLQMLFHQINLQVALLVY
jgi:hypothetical protein